MNSSPDSQNPPPPEENQGSAEDLLPMTYPQLRAIAARYMEGQRAGHTLQATALVNEAYLKLGDVEQSFETRRHFLRMAARAMRSVLVDHARARATDKRGGGWIREPLEEGMIFTGDGDQDLVALDEALNRLAEMDARKAQVVELRFFGGLSVPEAAEVLGHSPETVKRDWRSSKAWLRRELEGNRGS